MIPLLRIVMHICPAFTGKGQDALPVGVDPHVPDLLLEFLQLLDRRSIQLPPKPAQKLVPGVQLQRADLNKG